MTDVFAIITDADEEVQHQLADVLETRAENPRQRAMLDEYLDDVPILASHSLPAGASVLEVGCGTGPVVRALAERPGVGEVIGLDPSAILLEHARTRSDHPSLSFVQGDARALPFADNSFDVVVLHTVLCHVPEPDRALREAHRVTAPGGWVAVFEGDYATTTVATSADDVLQTCALATTREFVHDRWIVRRLPLLVEEAGYRVGRPRSFGYVETTDAKYMLTIVDRGADAMARSGTLSEDGAQTIKAEARRRVTCGEFFGFIAYMSVVGQR
jgi:ubiquinone/menaquinone biosynthesis C-methylase UbiE